MRIHLPVDDCLPELVETLKTAGCVVLKAPAGAGKTTRVPPALLDSGIAGTGQILMLEPRRIAARTAAARIASERQERLGQTVGFRVRFEEAVSAATRVLVVTEGVLLRRLQDDPFLEDVSLVIFDEFHERRLDSDLALAMVRRIQQTVRPDLKLVVMSATMEPAPIAAFLGDCPIVVSEGRLYPVEIRYAGRQERQAIPFQAADGVRAVLDETEGDVLVFLPGVGEIYRTAAELESLAQRRGMDILPLFGDMPLQDQDRVLAPSSRRKLILSTNVAETSVTIEGVTAVVDSGFARQMMFDADTGLDQLDLVPVSRASANQRAGRAGRTRPGLCLRLWDESSQRRRAEYELAELHRVDLSGAVLRLMAWGEADVRAFPWLERPSENLLDHALSLLRLLGAVDESGLTRRGRLLAGLPAAPRIAALLLDAAENGETSRACLMAALLTERDPFLRGGGDPWAGRSSGIQTTAIRHSRSDVLDRLHAIEDWFEHRQQNSVCGEINRNAAANIRTVADQLQRLIRETGVGRSATTPQTREESDTVLLRALVAGFPDRVARRRDASGDKGLMVGGRGVRCGPRSAVRRTPLFLCVDIDGAGTDALVRQASEVQLEWLPAAALQETEELFFHPSRKEVVARRRQCFGDLVLEETPARITDAARAAEVLYDATASQLQTIFPADDETVTGFLARVRCWQQWMPELQVPVFDEAAVRDVLRELCMGRRSVAELQSAPWIQTLQSRLDWKLQQRLDEEVPEKLLVPSGSRIRLQYEQGRPPILAVRIQELFGMTQTPRIAGGRIPVLLHLLAPNYRPQQVTDDLASFWANTYQDVKKDLKRRYPKHAWPDDPLTAQAVRKG